MIEDFQTFYSVFKQFTGCCLDFPKWLFSKTFLSLSTYFLISYLSCAYQCDCKKSASIGNIYFIPFY